MESRQSFLFVVGMVRERMSHDQQALLIGRHLHIVVLVKAILGAVLHAARIRIGEVILIFGARSRFRRLRGTSFGFVVALTRFLGAFFHFGFVLRCFGRIAFAGTLLQHLARLSQIDQPLLP